MFYSEEQYEEYQRDLLGDGYTNEYQRVYAQSCMTTRLHNDEPEARRLTLAGKFVVMASLEVCCRFTDGLIGYDYVIQGVFDTLEEARMFLEQDGPSDIGIYRIPAPRLEPQPVEDIGDEIPF